MTVFKGIKKAKSANPYLGIRLHLGFNKINDLGAFKKKVNPLLQKIIKNTIVSVMAGYRG